MSGRHLLDGEGAVACTASPRPDGANVSSDPDAVTCEACVRVAYFWDRVDAEQEWASRWLDAWDRLEALGIVGPDDRAMTLDELERLVSYLG